MSKRDYYEVLDIPKDASTDEIKKAFRKKAMEYHPDRNPDNPEAKSKFEEAKEAQEVLIDANKRATYDKFGHVGPQAQRPSWEDFFNRFGNSPTSRRGNDLKINIKLTLEEIYTGTKKNFNINRHQTCITCGGHGGTNPKQCEKCHGTGTVAQTIDLGFAHTVAPATCPKCSGIGEIVESFCISCNGKGVVSVQDSFDVTIPEELQGKFYIS